jgi:hypothetical protein
MFANQKSQNKLMTISKEISANDCKFNTLNLQVSDFLLNTHNLTRRHTRVI